MAAKLCVVLLVSSITIRYGSAQVYPHLLGVEVRATVIQAPTDSFYYFTYSLTNGINSIGKIQQFRLDISRRATAIHYDTVGLRFAGSSFLENNFRRHYGQLEGRIVPTGFFNLPQGWSGPWGNITFATISLNESFVPPGNTVSDFVLMSKGPPTIRAFVIKPHFNDDALFPSIDDSVITVTAEQIDSIREAVNFAGFTIGPGAPDFSFKPTRFIDTISSYVSLSRSFDWVPSQQTADKYTALLLRMKIDCEEFNLEMARSRIDSIFEQANSDSASSLLPEAYALIRFNTEYLQSKLTPTGEVRGGIIMPSSGNLSVKAKPSVDFGPTDTLKCIVATVRWPAAYNVSLGSVTGTYGFTKYDSVVTVGNYRYQKFGTTTDQTLNWSTGTEYELFTVSISGLCGAETFELSNALSDGEWFVDINYLDKTDSVFYQSVAQGFAYQNKSAASAATAFSGERHAALHGTKFHEVFESAGEIVYRRKDVNTAAWDTTTRISGGNGTNNDASIAVAHDGSVHVVWQRQLNTNAFALWYNRSTDGGFTWGTPFRPASAESVVIIQNNQWNIYPLIAERGTSQLVVVVCSNVGPRYMVSTDLGTSWTTLATIPNVSYGSYVWRPSLAPGSDFLLLSYDTRYFGLCSKKYDGTNWLAELNVANGVGTSYNRYSSVAVASTDVPYIAWSAQRSGQSEYRILYKSGAPGATAWNSFYTEFPYSAGKSDYDPSISAQGEGGGGGEVWRIDVLYANTSNQILLNQQTYGSWGSPSVVSNTGQWPATTLQELSSSLDNSIRIWTDQSGSTPYEIKRVSDGSYQLQSVTGTIMETELHRRVTLESVEDGSFVSFEVGPLKMVSATGDTTIIPFKAIDGSKPFVATLENAWDYLGTDSIRIPSNARRMIFDAYVETVVRGDTLGSKGSNVFPARSFRIELGGTRGSVPVLSEAQAASGLKVMDVASWVGQKVVIRPKGTAATSTGENPIVGIGDIFVRRGK